MKEKIKMNIPYDVSLSSSLRTIIQSERIKKTVALRNSDLSFPRKSKMQKKNQRKAKEKQKKQQQAPWNRPNISGMLFTK